MGISRGCEEVNVVGRNNYRSKEMITERYKAQHNPPEWNSTAPQVYDEQKWYPNAEFRCLNCAFFPSLWYCILLSHFRHPFAQDSGEISTNFPHLWWPQPKLDLIFPHLCRQKRIEKDNSLEGKCPCVTSTIKSCTVGLCFLSNKCEI